MDQKKADEQVNLDLESPRTPQSPSELSALDLFSGIGGLAAGFQRAGFAVIGADIEEVAQQCFPLTGAGEFVLADLSKSIVARTVDVVTGGPPCTPWSAVNQQRRSARHNDHGLLARFFDHIVEIRPAAFLMENVPAIGSDLSYLRCLDVLRTLGYRADSKLVRYSDYGGASARRRRFTVGFRNSYYGAREFFTRLEAHRTAPKTVRKAIFWARNIPRGGFPDHDWSVLNTIERYRERYDTGKFGWKRLDYDAPAPSFGSVAKTYILHPEAGLNGFPLRVLSVREALSLMDFGSDFRYPEGTARAKRYRMTANTVSPKVAYACATVLRELLNGEGTLQRVVSEYGNLPGA